MPAVHGTYEDIELDLINPDSEDNRRVLFEAIHPQFWEALQRGGDVLVVGEPVNPRLHVTMHEVVASQLLGDDPPETWQTVQRLAAMGYDWHNTVHMIAGLVAEDVHRLLATRERFDRSDYVQRLNELPGDWPPPEELD